MIEGYPSHTLVYWQNEQSGQLIRAVQNFFDDSVEFDKTNVSLIRDYLKHWVGFRGHYFPKEDDRQSLIKELDESVTRKDFNQIIDKLLGFAIDPF